jgi:F-type H+-transporting ATPase subunit alpha
MKKVAGTLKLDQAQYRELEAFSKFGSDLDPATMAVLDKGRKNVELLKQPQYNPVPVEQQVAVIYCGTMGLLRDVPINKVKDFEREFIENLQLRHSDVLKNILSGKFDDEITGKIEQVARDVASQYNKDEEEE